MRKLPKLNLMMAMCLLVATVRESAAETGAPTQQAEDYVRDGTKWFQLGQYAAALESFQAASLADPDPTLLVRIADCYRMMGNAEKAAQSYRLYLKERPQADDRKEIEARLRELDAKSASAAPAARAGDGTSDRDDAHTGIRSGAGLRHDREPGRRGPGNAGAHDHRPSARASPVGRPQAEPEARRRQQGAPQDRRRSARRPPARGPRRALLPHRAGEARKNRTWWPIWS